MMAWSLHRDDCVELRNQFLALDLDETGTISLKEFCSVLEDNYHIDSKEAQHLFENLDTDGDAEISYSEFLAAAMCDHVRMHDDLLLKTWRRFDAAGDGGITVENLRSVLGDSFEGAAVKDLLQEADMNRDGVVVYEEFIAFLGQEETDEEDALTPPSADSEMTRRPSKEFAAEDKALDLTPLSGKAGA